MEDRIKENLEISSKKLDIMSESQIGVALDECVEAKQWRPDPSGAGTRVTAKRAKASRKYRDSSDDYVKKLATTQGSGEPGILKFTASSRNSKISVAASYTRRYSDGWGTARSQHTRRPKRSRC